MISKTKYTKRIIKSSSEIGITGQNVLPEWTNPKEDPNEVSHYKAIVSVGDLNFDAIPKKDYSEIAASWESVLKSDSTEFQEFEGYSPEVSTAAIIDLSHVDFAWIELDEFEEVDLNFMNKSLNTQLQEKEQIISNLKSQIKKLNIEIKKNTLELNKCDDLNKSLKIKDNTIEKLNKKIFDYKKKLEYFSVDFSLPEDYYGNEEFNI